MLSVDSLILLVCARLWLCQRWVSIIVLTKQDELERPREIVGRAQLGAYQTRSRETCYAHGC